VSLTWGQRIGLGMLTFSIIGLFFIPATMLWDKSNIEMGSLTAFESTVKDIGLTKIKIGKGYSKSETVYLTLDDLNIDFGIYYTDSAMRQSCINKIHKRDRVRIMYDKTGQEVYEGFNLHIYQLEYDGEILIDKDDVNKRDSTFSKIMFGLGLAFMLWPVLLYGYIRKNNAKLTSV
jgi:hypothetical protein